MLRSPRRLPRRFNRSVTPQTRRLIDKRMQRRKQMIAHRFQRIVQRWQRKVGTMKKFIMQFAALVVGGALLVLIGLALFSPMLHIREIRISRSDPRIDIELVQYALAALFDEHLFFLSSSDVTPLLRQTLERAGRPAVPDLKEAFVSKQYPSTLQIRLTLDPIIARLTMDDPSKKKGAAGSGSLTGTGSVNAPQGQDYLTSEGVYTVYQPSQVQSSSGVLQLNVVDWGVRPEPWKQLIEPQVLHFMRSAEAELKAQFDIDVRSRTVYVRAREFHLKTPKYTLWFDLRSTLPEQLQRFRLYVQAAGVDAAKEYVDLRLKDKIVYK